MTGANLLSVAQPRPLAHAETEETADESVSAPRIAVR
jgi:hypothetical protein